MLDAIALDADVKPGHCLLCITTPATDLTLTL